MEYQDYVNQAQQAARLVEKGDRSAALRSFQELLKRDISDLDKSYICQNLAIISEQDGQLEQALHWYDLGINYEKPHLRFQVYENKAGFLLRLGKQDEAKRIYQKLLKKNFLTEEAKFRIGQYLVQLNG